MHLFRDINEVKELFVEEYLQIIEKSVFIYNNTEILEKLIVHDSTLNFKNELKLCKQFIKIIFINFDWKEYKHIYKLID